MLEMARCIECGEAKNRGEKLIKSKEEGGDEENRPM